VWTADVRRAGRPDPSPGSDSRPGQAGRPASRSSSRPAELVGGPRHSDAPAGPPSRAGDGTRGVRLDSVGNR
jgi:hypothetical protein